MWDNLRQQIVSKLETEIKSTNNWDKIKAYFNSKEFDNLVLRPLRKGINSYLNKYLIIFISVNIIIMILITANILITMNK